jgi:hypothetical protein
MELTPRRVPRVTTCSGSGGSSDPTVVTGTIDIGNTVPITGEVALNTANATGDAFSRLRVSNPFTLFEFNSIIGTGEYSTVPSVIDTRIVGSGTVTHSNDSYTAMTVSGNGDAVYRQSHEYIPYQPGKSKLVMMTGVLHMGSDINPSYTTNALESRIGIFDDEMGIFIQFVNGTYSIVLRSNTGATQAVVRSAWEDPLDGSGASGIIVDFTHAQIFLFDLEWLGVGQVRCGIVQSGTIHYFHKFSHINDLYAPYTVSAKLPLRYEIISTGSANEMRMICGSVISEGGFSPFGLRSTFPVGTPAQYNTDYHTTYSIPNTVIPYWKTEASSGGGNPENLVPLISFRVKNTYPYRCGSIRIKLIDIFSPSANTYGVIRLVLNAAVTAPGEPGNLPVFKTYSATSSVAEVCLHRRMGSSSGGYSDHTYTPGTGIVTYNNFYNTRQNALLFSSTEEMITQPALTVNLNGVSDTFTVLANSLNSSQNTIYASVEWIEFI